MTDGYLWQRPWLDYLQRELLNYIFEFLFFEVLWLLYYNIGVFIDTYRLLCIMVPTGNIFKLSLMLTIQYIKM